MITLYDKLKALTIIEIIRDLRYNIMKECGGIPVICEICKEKLKTIDEFEKIMLEE